MSLGVAPVTTDDGRTLVSIAKSAIRNALAGSGRLIVPLNNLGARLREPGASFVSLHREALLGCIGTMTPCRALAQDVADNALSAAFADPRLPEITAADFVAMTIEVSVLGPLERLDVSSYSDLRARVRPGTDGLLVTVGQRRGVFLPKVWTDLADRDRFLESLWQKARLEPRTWPEGITVDRYVTVEFDDPGPRPAIERSELGRSV